MSVPSFTASGSLYATSQHYRLVGIDAAGRSDFIFPQQFCRHLEQSCFGLEFSCCPGLMCSPRPLGPGICVPCPPCGPCQIDLVTGGCSRVCYSSRPPFGGCFRVNVPCDPSSSACCTELKNLCIAGGGAVQDCSGFVGTGCSGCDCCQPCCFKCI
jgi:hypothetical protein